MQGEPWALPLTATVRFAQSSVLRGLQEEPSRLESSPVLRESPVCAQVSSRALPI